MTMQDLTAALKSAGSDIDSLYSKIGAGLLRREEEDYKDSPQDAPAGLADWKKLMREREEAASSVLAIKDSLKRAQELGKAEKDIAKSLAEAKKKMRAAALAFARAFWDEYSPERFPSFAPVYEAASAEKQACQEIEARQRSVSDGIEEGKRLSKMMAHFRGAGLSAQLYYRKTRFEQAVAAAMESLAADGGAARLGEELRAADSGRLSESFAPFNEAAGVFLSVSRRMKSSSDEKQAVNETLEMHGAAENPSKRLDALRAAIKEKDAAIDNICRAKGKDHVALFFDDKGAPFPGAGNAASDEFKQQLLEFSRLAAWRSRLERRIDILQTEAKIRQLDKTMAGHSSEIDSLKKRIESMAARVESLEKAIGDISSEKAGLQSYIEKIKAEEGDEGEAPALSTQGGGEAAAEWRETGGQAPEDAEIVETSEN